jgi:oxygen-independent coproporphyrinogen-3 oxidase
MILYIYQTFKKKNLSGIYIHIPYCKQQCTYCDFHFRISQKDKLEMLKSMEKEIEFKTNYLSTKSIKTIYFGGGTPSILNIEEINSLINTIKDNYKISEGAEITLECNPDDLTEKKLLSLKEVGINRLSIGIQSFKDKDLEFMNRSHNSKEGIDCIKTAKKVGFNNITVDLIYGLPNQTVEEWEENLDILFSLDIQHISAYALTVENKTALNHLIKTGKIKALPDEKTIEQFNILQEKTKERGFIHYEISNFGKENFFSKHNTAYWQSKEYIGIGPSAHSFNGISRSWNISSNKKYIDGIQDDKSFSETEILTIEQQYNEYVFTSLRTIWGVDLDYLSERFLENITEHFLKEIAKWIEKGYIQKTNKKYTLTQKGKAFADGVSSDLFIV